MLADRGQDQSPTLRRTKPAVRFIAGHNSGDRFILDGIPQPARIVPMRQVKAPGLLIHAFRQLREQIHVLRPEVQFPFRTAKVKAFVFPEFARGIFALMAAALILRGLELYVAMSWWFWKMPGKEASGFTSAARIWVPI